MAEVPDSAAYHAVGDSRCVGTTDDTADIHPLLSILFYIPLNLLNLQMKHYIANVKYYSEKSDENFFKFNF